jgi:hypothetical protein
MSMFYKLASAVLARTTGRAVVAMRFRRKIHCAFGSVRRRSGARPHFFLGSNSAFCVKT